MIYFIFNIYKGVINHHYAYSSYKTHIGLKYDSLIIFDLRIRVFFHNDICTVTILIVTNLTYTNIYYFTFIISLLFVVWTTWRL